MIKKEWKIDVIYILFLLILNPVVFLGHGRFESIFPDAVAYITLGTDLLSEGMLYLEQWGHVDNGLILPPFYPFLIGIGRLLFFDDGLIMAELVSSVCIVLSIIPWFFYLSRLINREIAAVTILLIQFNYYYLYFGTLALSEATFIFTLSMGLWLAQKTFCTSTGGKKIAILLGLIAALIFLSRQIGIVFILVIMTIWLARSFLGTIQQRRQSQAITLYIIIGFSFLIVPYGIVLYEQTGQSIFTQHFRLGKYVVTQSQANQVILQQISGGDPNFFNKLGIDPTTITGFSKPTFEDTYAQRRRMRELLPDSSEMHGKIFEDKYENPLAEKIWEKIKQPNIVINNFINNFRHLEEPLGLVLPYIFLLTVISAFFIKVKTINVYTRILLPVFIITYWLVVSVFTGIIERYMHVIFILILVHILIEVSLIFKRFFPDATKKISVLGILLLFSSTLVATPRLFISADAKPKVGESANLLGDCSRLVDSEPVFSLHPLEAYLFGGRFRELPNDSLDKVAQYANNTKVKWLIIVDNSDQQIYYSKAGWLDNKNLENQYSEQIKLRCRDRGVSLYEFN